MRYMLIAVLFIFASLNCLLPSPANAMTIDEAAIAEIEVRDFDANTRTSFRRCLVFFDNLTLNLPESNFLTAKCIDTETIEFLLPQEEPVEPAFHTLYEEIGIDSGWTTPAPPQTAYTWQNCTLWKRRYQLVYHQNTPPLFYAKYVFDCIASPATR